MIVSILVGALALSFMQETPPAPTDPAASVDPQAAAAAPAAPSSGEEWQRVAATERRGYLADVSSIQAVADGVTNLTAALVPRGNVEAGDQSHTLESYAFRCRADQFRVPLSREVGPDGQVTDSYDDSASDWSPIPASGLPRYLKDMACENARSTKPPFPTIAAYVEAGRPE